MTDFHEVRWEEKEFDPPEQQMSNCLKLWKVPEDLGTTTVHHIF